ncbi:MarR family winged helix-turn-helix transcriptional regulator [Pseudonocardia spinosispora]|uniref:MarR family winged helix-turn-helix transcriptional regulator n=1 Tax=Pseudonocardia spinosispora TaxID=103441 RepID=UPI0003FA88EB|nr:MarR family transcriptional regulator [Pseudonocardia spinosispora]
MTEQPCRLGQVEIALRRHVAASTRLDHEVGARAGLHLSTCEANFVNLLLLHGPLSPGELGQLSGTGSSGTITGVIDRLERAGYVRRSRCVVDRRKVEVELDAERLAADTTDRSRLLAEVAAGYTADQLALIAGFLDRLADAESAMLTQIGTAAS